MCRRAGKPDRDQRLGAARIGSAAALWCCLLLAGGSWLGAQTGGEPFPLATQTRNQLIALQESWIEWLSHMQQGEMERASVVVDSLLSQAAEIGMSGLPDLAIAAAAQAVTFATESEATKAHAALAAAERLQPREPAVAFAAMSVAWTQGRVVSAASWWAKGVVRVFRAPLIRRVALGNLVHWLLVVLSLSAFSFVGVQMATRGFAPVRDLAEFIRHSLPTPAAYLLAGVLMLWPVLLPSGLLWLALYWSVLLWGYGSRGERVVMILLWVFVGILPFLVSEHVRRLDFGISAPVQALENAAEGRLTGSLFSDLGILFEMLPDSLTVRHLQADLHLQLRQWEQARGAYQEVLAMESGNAAALADLGTVHFHEGDLDNAVRYLQQAASVPDAPVQIYFNLSRALSEQYRFGESESMLRRASTLDSEAVGGWINAVAANQLVTVSAGLGKRKEIERELAGAWRSDEDASLTAMWRRMLSVPLALVLVGPAIGVFLLARRSRHRPRRDSEPWFENVVERIRVAVLPGLSEIERRRPVRAWLALAIALAFFTLPFSAGFGFPLPLGYSRALPVVWAVAAGGIGLFVLIRFFVVDRGRKRKV